MTDAMSDDELLARLAAAVDRGVGDVPADLTAVARDAARWAVVDEELAAIVDAAPAATTRAGDGGSTTFTAPPYEITLSLLEATLIGEIVPPPGSEVVVETPTATRAVSVDARGRFRAPATSGPYRVRFGAGDRRITTPWVTR